MSKDILYGSFHCSALGYACGEEGDNDGDGYSLDTPELAQVGVSDRSAQQPYSPMKREDSVSQHLVYLALYIPDGVDLDGPDNPSRCVHAPSKHGTAAIPVSSF